MTSEDGQKLTKDDFLQSWDRAERRFKALEHSSMEQSVKQMLDLIKEFRCRGYDHQLLASAVLITLLLSRYGKSSFLGLEAQLVFKLKPEGGMEITYWEGELDGIKDGRIEIKHQGEWTKFEVENIELTPKIEDLLTRLLAYPID